MLEELKLLKEQVALCDKAEEDLVSSIAPFIGYWEIVQSTKKQVSILKKQKRFLLSEIEKLK